MREKELLQFKRDLRDLSVKRNGQILFASLGVSPVEFFQGVGEALGSWAGVRTWREGRTVPG